VKPTSNAASRDGSAAGSTELCFRGPKLEGVRPDEEREC
jgi:hypothetical protein